MVVVTFCLTMMYFLERIAVVCGQEGCGDMMVETCEQDESVGLLVVDKGVE